MGYRTVNGWRLWIRHGQIEITDPDNKIQTTFRLGEEDQALEWARKRNDHVREGNHSRGYTVGWRKKEIKGIFAKEGFKWEL